VLNLLRVCVLCLCSELCVVLAFAFGWPWRPEGDVFVCVLIVGSQHSYIVVLFLCSATACRGRTCKT